MISLFSYLKDSCVEENNVMAWRDARSCKSGVKRVHSWLNTGFIMKRTVLGMCVQHLWNSRTFNRLKNGFTSRN